MVEVKNGKKILTTPISAEDLEGIHVGDIVYLNGSMTTCRDVAHRRLVEEHRELPVDVKDAAIFHAGPIIRPLPDDKFEMVSIGPTTSMRMEKFEKEFVEQTGVRVIIGKAAWARIRSTHARTSRRSTAYSRPDVLLLPQPMLSRSWKHSGETSECQRPYGTVM